MNLTHLDTLKELFEKHGIRPNSRASQNFLICPQTVETVVSHLTAGPKPVTEIGSGPGALTHALLAAGHTVRAIEKDPVMATILTEEVTTPYADHVTVVAEDARTATWSWDEPYQLVGNIPYHLTGALVRQLVQIEPVPERAILLVQREVADRLTADVPDMSLLTLAVRLWGEATRIASVPPHCFWPQPKVSSALVELVPHDTSLPLPRREQIVEHARPFFQARRKQFGGVLKRTYSLTGDAVADITAKLDLSPTIRPQEISADQWILLSEALKQQSPDS